MSDLATIIRDYYESSVEPVTAAEAMAQTERIDLVQRRKVRPHRAIAFVGAALALLLAVGLAAVLLPGDSDLVDQPQPTDTSVPTSLPSTTAPPATSVPPTMDWAAWTMVQPAEDPTTFAGSGHILNAIAGSEGVLVAVGDSRGSGNMRDGLIVTSSDGFNWERVSDADDLEFGGKGLNAVVAGGPGFVAAGQSSDTEERGPFLPAIWTSTNGTEWDRVPHDPELFGDGGGILDLLVRDSEILASGAICREEMCSFAVWSSPDGLGWERISESDHSAWGLVADDSVLLAFGMQTILVSTDGTDWEPVPRSPEVFGDDPEAPWVVYDIASGPAGFVAVGTDGTDAIVWLSVDGRSWERLPHNPVVFGDASMKSVMPWGDGYLAVGPEWAVSEEIGGPEPGYPSVPAPPEAWVSPDGRSWQRFEMGNDAAAVRSIIEHEGTLIAVGQHGTFLEGGDAIWVNSSSTESAAVAEAAQAFTPNDDSYPTSTVVTTESTDADTTTQPVVQGPMTWSRTPFDGSVNAVVAGDMELIAAGSADGAAALWRSPDGMTWTQVPLDQAVFGGYWIYDLVATSDGYAAIGGDGKNGTEIVAWTSPDGLEWVRNAVEGIAQGEIRRLDIKGLTDGPSGLVAVGWTTEADRSYMLDDHVVIHSADGTDWRRVDTSYLPLGGMKDVTAGGPGYVAVGIDGSGDVGPGVWTSADGVDWTLIDGANVEWGPDEGLADIEEVAVSDDGRLYAFGVGTVWVSEDGSIWSRLGRYVGEPEDEFDSEWGGWTNAEVVSGDRIVLVGALEAHGFGPDRAAVWASEDGGISWERMSRPPGIFGDGGANEMQTVAEIGGTYVAFGEWNGETNVWVGAWNEDE